MTTTDSNGIVFLEDTDTISPLHTLMNTLQQGTSDVIKETRHGPLYAANNTERDMYYATYGASSTEPLWVDVAGVLYRTIDGTNWVTRDTNYVIRNADGTSSPAGSRPIIQAFPVQDNVNGSGIITVTFPQPFTAKPVVSAQTVLGASFNPVVNSNNVTPTTVQLIWPGLTSGTMRVHIQAIGW